MGHGASRHGGLWPLTAPSANTDSFNCEMNYMFTSRAFFLLGVILFLKPVSAQERSEQQCSIRTGIEEKNWTDISLPVSEVKIKAGTIKVADANGNHIKASENVTVSLKTGGQLVTIRAETMVVRAPADLIEVQLNYEDVDEFSNTPLGMFTSILRENPWIPNLRVTWAFKGTGYISYRYNRITHTLHGSNSAYTYIGVYPRMFDEIR